MPTRMRYETRPMRRSIEISLPARTPSAGLPLIWKRCVHSNSFFKKRVADDVCVAGLDKFALHDVNPPAWRVPTMPRQIEAGEAIKASDVSP